MAVHARVSCWGVALGISTHQDIFRKGGQPLCANGDAPLCVVFNQAGNAPEELAGSQRAPRREELMRLVRRVWHRPRQSPHCRCNLAGEQVGGGLIHWGRARRLRPRNLTQCTDEQRRGGGGFEGKLLQ